MRRYDRSEITVAKRTPQGFIKAPAFFTRTGVFTYRMPDGSVVRELRHPEDVFKKESLDTLSGIPITDEHPPEGLVTVDTAKSLMVGYTGDSIEVEEDKVGGSVTITDPAVIQKVESGLREMSCGYDHELEKVSGVYDGEAYDARQRNIVYNHVALTEKGRAGPSVRLRLDSADAVMIEENEINQEEKMEKLMIGGKEFEVSPELKAAIESEMTKLVADNADAKKAKDEACAVKDEMNKEVEKLEGKVDSLKDELRKKEAALAQKNDSVKLHEAVKERMNIERVATEILPEGTKLDSMDNIAIKKAVIESYGNVKLDGKSEEYVSARFDQLIDLRSSNADLGKALVQRRAEDSSETLDAEKVRIAAQKRDSEAWKKPLTASNKKSA